MIFHPLSRNIRRGFPAQPARLRTRFAGVLAQQRRDGKLFVQLRPANRCAVARQFHFAARGRLRQNQFRRTVRPRNFHEMVVHVNHQRPRTEFHFGSSLRCHSVLNVTASRLGARPEFVIVDCIGGIHRSASPSARLSIFPAIVIANCANSRNIAAQTRITPVDLVDRQVSLFSSSVDF